MQNSYDYRVLAKFLAGEIKTMSGYPLIESNSNGEMPDFPFCTYTIISPYIPITVDIVNKEVFECVVSLTWHCRSGLEAVTLAQQTNKYFRSFDGRLSLEQNGIIFVEATSAEQRDNFISIEYERLAGIDIRFRLSDNFIDEVVNIDNIEI